MILVDTNVWIALAFGQHPNHAVAQSTLAHVTSAKPAFFCRATEQSFLRLASTPALFRRYGVVGITNEDALAMLMKLLALPGITSRDEPTGIVAQWHAFARRTTASPKLWMDAYLAAFAIAGGLTFVTLDADYRQFESAGLKLTLLSGS